MTPYARARKKINRANAGRHTGDDHVPGQRCFTCQPLPLTIEQRAAAKVQEAERRIAAMDPYKAMTERALLGMSAVRVTPRDPVHHGQGLRPRRSGPRRGSRRGS